MSQQSSAGAAGSTQQAIAENGIWFKALGIILIVLGILAICFPLMTTIAAKVFLGWLFLAGGIFQVFHAFSTRTWAATFLNLFIGVLRLFVGGWLAFFPLTGVVTLTVLLAAGLLVQGILELVMALRIRPVEGWVWLLVSGLVALAVGFMIFAQLPISAIWTIGVLIGINLITSGGAYFFLALAAGKSR